MNFMTCANCYWRDSFTGFCSFRNSSPTPFYWCPAWYDSIWISMLFSECNELEYEYDEYECDEYEKFLEKLVENT